MPLYSAIFLAQPRAFLVTLLNAQTNATGFTTLENTHVHIPNTHTHIKTHTYVYSDDNTIKTTLPDDRMYAVDLTAYYAVEND